MAPQVINPTVTPWPEIGFKTYHEREATHLTETDRRRHMIPSAILDCRCGRHLLPSTKHLRKPSKRVDS